MTITCDVDYDHNVIAGFEYIELLWPEEYQVHYDTGPLSFPRSPEATVEDNETNSYSYLTPVLAADDYNCAIVPVRDDVEQLTGIVEEVITINEVPEAPSDLYATGDAGGLVINWTSNESGATYTVYSSLIDDIINYGRYDEPAIKTTIADAESATLDPVDLTNLPGWVRVVVRASKGGVQEQNDAVLRIELDDAGNILYDRPNDATINSLDADGLTVNVNAGVFTYDAEADADYVDLFVASYDELIDISLTSAVDTALLGSEANGVRSAELHHTFDDEGWYKIAVLARVDGTDAQSADYEEKLVYVSNDKPAAVSNLRIAAQRGDEG